MGWAILIVDDEPVICEMIEKELKRSFYSTYIAHCGKEAIEILKNNNIDIIILDIFIPDMPELSLLAQIRQNWDHIEIIVMTGHSSQEMAIQSLRMGAIDYFEKPIDYNELNTSIGRAIEKITIESQFEYKYVILLVDDDIETTTKLKKILEKEGYIIYIASNGADAVDIYRKNKIDIIITDIEMPIMSGITLLEKAKKFQKDIEVIMMTGFGDENLAIESLRKGAKNYLRKPINIDELLFSIKQAIEKILLCRNQLFRTREIKLNSKIVSKINEELEKRIEERTKEISIIQTQLFQTSKLAVLGEVAAGLAHELNQPLTGILLCNANMKKMREKELLTDFEINESITTIELLVKRMNVIIVHMRSFARQDAQKFANMDINESVKNAFSLMGEQLRLHDITTVQELDLNLPSIYGEPYQIEQVIINIISNSRDSFDEEESNYYNRALSWTKSLNIKTFVKNDWVCIEITDNGCGMSDKTMDKIFQPFYTTKGIGKATGLGMSISFGIIKSHKGRIDVTSNVGKGTIITIKLPHNLHDEWTG